MRPLCDVCQSAAAIVFCAADEAALCPNCDQKVHMCNKLASRHVRVGLADPSDLPRCDICENAPAFFYCEIDGTSLCLRCDMIVHVGGKRTHGRYLMFRQRLEFPGDKNAKDDELKSQLVDVKRESNLTSRENQHHRLSSVGVVANDTNGVAKTGNKLFDLNTRPQRVHGQTSNHQDQEMDINGSKEALEK